MSNSSSTKMAESIDNLVLRKVPVIRSLFDKMGLLPLSIQKKEFLAKRTMKLIDPESGLMECQVCGSRHFALVPPVGGDKETIVPGFKSGSWQCKNGCRLYDKK